jgi:hypothetical protein
MARALVLCIEGKIDQNFFGAILIKNGFSTPPKQQNIYHKGDILVFIPPCSGISSPCGKHALRQKSKYETMPVSIDSLLKRHGFSDAKKDLIVCFDTDSPSADSEKAAAEIRKQAEKYFGPHGDVHIFPISGVIENWFIAGLPAHIHGVQNSKKFGELIFNDKPDFIEDAKNHFYGCFFQPEETTLISRRTGDDFDIKLAKKLSPTFKIFAEVFERYL